MNPFVILAALIPIASAFLVNTPTAPVVCQPLQLTWVADGSQPPYYLSLIPAGQTTARALKQFPRQDGTSYTWPNVSLPVGTSFAVALKDANGQQVYSAPATVEDGGDTSCVNSEVMEGSASSSTTAANSSPGVAAVNHDTTSLSPAAAAVSTPPPSSKSETAKPSGGSASPSQPLSVKANSVARDVSSGAVVGIMFAVGLTSVLVSLVV